MSFGAIRQTSPNSGYLQEQRSVRKIIDPMRHVHARVRVLSVPLCTAPPATLQFPVRI
jgi:hypothetical protein